MTFVPAFESLSFERSGNSLDCVSQPCHPVYGVRSRNRMANSARRQQNSSHHLKSYCAVTCCEQESHPRAPSAVYFGRPRIRKTASAKKTTFPLVKWCMQSAWTYRKMSENYLLKIVLKGPYLLPISPRAPPRPEKAGRADFRIHY